MLSPALILRENSERGGALHSFRRSIHLQQNKRKMDSDMFQNKKQKAYLNDICIYIYIYKFILLVFGANGEYRNFNNWFKSLYTHFHPNPHSVSSFSHWESN